MSCFLVSDNHLGAIIGYACRENLKTGYGGNPGRYAYAPGEEQAACDILYAANAKSVNARYTTNVDESGCTYHPNAIKLRPIEVIKACDCYAYQCDEWDGFEGSEAQRIVDGIREHAIGKLPGYDAAEWSID